MTVQTGYIQKVTNDDEKTARLIALIKSISEVETAPVVKADAPKSKDADSKLELVVVKPENYSYDLTMQLLMDKYGKGAKEHFKRP